MESAHMNENSQLQINTHCFSIQYTKKLENIITITAHKIHICPMEKSLIEG